MPAHGRVQLDADASAASLVRLEECGLNAWPALQQVLYDGWVLRFSGGYTKRANSVNALYPSTLDPIEKIEACERAYLARGLRPTFRLTPFSHPAGLDGLLEARGYDTLDPTEVRTLDLSSWRPGANAPPLPAAELDEWLPAFCALRGQPLSDHETHRRMLELIAAETRFLLLRGSGQPVTCGLGVVEDGCMGLFDLLVSEGQRRQGFGKRVVEELLRWAQERGAKTAYLQVMESNEPALGLYGKIGYERRYRYWYRVPTA